MFWRQAHTGVQASHTAWKNMIPQCGFNESLWWCKPVSAKKPYFHLPVLMSFASDTLLLCASCPTPRVTAAACLDISARGDGGDALTFGQKTL
jgi:hypothetical protein